MKKIVILLIVILAGNCASLAGDLKIAVPVEDYNKMQARIQAMESENNRLRHELTAVKESQQGSAATNADKQSMKGAVSAGTVLAATVPSSKEDGDLPARLEAVENDNARLRQEVRLLQAGALAEVYGEKKISAREQYFFARHKNMSHVFKF